MKRTRVPLHNAVSILSVRNIEMKDENPTLRYHPWSGCVRQRGKLRPSPLVLLLRRHASHSRANSHCSHCGRDLGGPRFVWGYEPQTEQVQLPPEMVW